MKDLLLVGLGGFLGSIARFGVGLGTIRLFEDRFYIGTMSVNLIGSLLIGVLFALISKQQNHISLFLVTGFCGGFSTFSTFSSEPRERDACCVR